MKKHTITEWGRCAPKAYLSNGLIGFRVGKNAFGDITGLMSGFTTYRYTIQGLADIPAPCISFSYKNSGVRPEIRSQSYDFSNGEFTTEAVLNCDGTSVSVTYTQFCSRTSPTLFIGTVKAVGDISEPLKLVLNYEINDHKETVAELKCEAPYPDPNVTSRFDGKCHAISADRTTDAGIAYRFFGSYSDKHYLGEMMSSVTLNTCGEPVHIVTSYVSGLMHSEPYNQAQRLLTLAEWTGIETLAEKNRQAWAKLWESRVVVDCDDEKWQDAIDASYFYLMSSASEFSPISVPPFGLSEDGYDGHCFWDTESFMFMAPLFCAPTVAKSMLKYRFDRLDAARNNASLNGYRGIQFPWQSGITGSEVTPPWATSAGEQHVNFDVALAFDGYARVHNDPVFVKDVVLPVIFGVCEWIESRVEKTDRGYEILHITGIDEGHDDVNNDFYSNTMAVKLLRSGSEYSVKFGYGEQTRWLEIADNMYVNFFEDGVAGQYDGADRNTGLTPLMSYFPYGYTNGTESDLATLKSMVYDRDIIGQCFYPMQSGYLGIFPAWLGDREFSLKVYEAGSLNFFCQPFYACTESSILDPEDRIAPRYHLRTSFITGRGSLLSGLIMGLTKMCPWKGSVDAPVDEWFGENIVLPEGWRKLTVGHITLRGKEYRLEAEHGAKRAKLIEL
ncbi:MAG: glycoside hydrolase family 65 protein [Clostridia bacterium]|nr:glycoside hydrolase family 65 protein [Clostridia bacterium]